MKNAMFVILFFFNFYVYSLSQNHASLNEVKKNDKNEVINLALKDSQLKSEKKHLLDQNHISLVELVRVSYQKFSFSEFKNIYSDEKKRTFLFAGSVTAGIVLVLAVYWISFRNKSDPEEFQEKLYQIQAEKVDIITKPIVLKGRTKKFPRDINYKDVEKYESETTPLTNDQ